MSRFFAVTVAVLAIASCLRLVLAQRGSPEGDLRAEQDRIACELDDQLIEQFKGTVRERHGVARGYAHSTYAVAMREGIPGTVRCREPRECRGKADVDITWCVNVYHPSERIELCWNRSSGETNATDYALRLDLSDAFGDQTTSPQDSGLQVNNPPYFLRHSVLTCTTHGPSCDSKRFHVLRVEKADGAGEPPHVTILNSNELMLGQRNIITCVADFNFQSASEIPGSPSCGWYVNGTSHDNMSPNCLDPTENDEKVCFEGRKRVRFYSDEYQVSQCPLRHYRIRSWMVIDDANEADTELTYECQAQYTAANPVQHVQAAGVKHSLIPVYPIANVIPLETPMLPAGQVNSSAPPTYGVKPGESLQWRCSVLAGVGDRLVWTLNGVEIPSLDTDYDFQRRNLTCALDSSSDVFVVADETRRVGEYERQLTSTLLLCRVTEFTAGLYECAVNQTRLDNVTKVWSANVQTAKQEANSVTTIILGVSMGCCAMLLVVILVATLLICYLCVKKRKQKKELDWTRDIFVMDDVPHITSGSSVRKAKDSSVMLQPVDPFEFPRSKLVFLNTILGEGTFGVVLQAKAEDIAKSAPHRNIVAVKTPRGTLDGIARSLPADKAPPHEIDNFWEELNLMKNMVPHSNIVNLLGHCTSPGGPIYMIIEYARYGSLKDFLRECEEAVLQLNHAPQILRCRSQDHQSGSSAYSPTSTYSVYPQLVDKSQLCSQNSCGGGGVFSPDITATPSTAAGGVFEFPPNKARHLTRERLTTQDSGFCGEPVDSSIHQTAFNDPLDGAVSMAHSVAPLTHDYINNKGLIYMEDVQNFALQIACGLKHLEDCQIVHCDLAARNILIAEGFLLKIGDFGMARDVSEKEYYRKQGGRIPVKWTAPEALKDHIFSFKSDIWSFGVVLWEILTYGQHPFPKFKIHHSWEPFINYLMEGNRLPHPNGCPDIFFDLMQSCWHSSPDKRPSADELVQVLSQKNMLVTSETFLESELVDSPPLSTGQ